ncbi:hypothetical protein AnigIFM56816_005172 [Aspergillus niger]|nr:hypothetical protein AnigIFM56816_005172 [Aspergillus niger]
MTRESNIVGGSLAAALPVTDKYWFQQPHLLQLNLVLLIPLLSSSTFGYDGSLMNGLQSLEQWQTYFNNPTGSLLGTIVAAQSIGSVIALPFLGNLCDWYGRKPILFTGLVIICIAATIQWYPLVQLAFLYWVPESPRWLVAQNRIQEATDILKVYHAGQRNPDEVPSPLVAVEMAEITHAIEFEKSFEATGWSTLVATPGNRRRTTIAICVGAFAQWNGIAVVSYYLSLVLDSVGITSSYTQTLINGFLQLFNFAAALMAAFLVDRLGRRTLFVWSSIGMFISFIVWTICSALTSETGSKAAGYVVIVCVFVVYFHYDIAWTPLLLGYPTEIFPYSLRSKGLAVEMMSVYGSLIIASFCNPIGMENLGRRYYIVFCVFLMGILATVYFYFPETKGHTLEEIAVIFDGDRSDLRHCDDDCLADGKK